jgi:hypothetical protein
MREKHSRFNAAICKTIMVEDDGELFITFVFEECKNVLIFQLANISFFKATSVYLSCTKFK